MVCLDTSVLFDNLRGKRQTVEFVKRLEESRITLMTIAVNSFELYYGAYRGKRQVKNTDATKVLLSRLIMRILLTSPRFKPEEFWFCLRRREIRSVSEMRL